MTLPALAIVPFPKMKVTVVAPPNPLPWIVIAVPPVAGPDDGAIPVTVTLETEGGVYVKFDALVTEYPSGFVIVTPTAPLPGGVTPLMLEQVCQVTAGASTPPNATVAPGLMLTPTMLTVVPPAGGPKLGEKLVKPTPVYVVLGRGCRVESAT